MKYKAVFASLVLASAFAVAQPNGNICLQSPTNNGPYVMDNHTYGNLAVFRQNYDLKVGNVQNKLAHGPNLASNVNGANINNDNNDRVNGNTNHSAGESLQNV